RKSTKRALLGSVMAMVLCLAMLVGATFAWFTDTASTGVNKITSGNLDVEIVNKEGEKVTSLKWVKAEGAAAESVLWEPGCRYQLEPFQIVNNGNLALKYKLVITGLTGDADLLKVIQFTYTIGDETLDLAGEGHLTAKGTDGAKSQPITITGAMDTAAGNEYMNKKLDNISITVVATQDTVESDSFGTQYDKDAEYPVAVTTGDELQAIVNNATAPVNVVLMNSITTNNFVIPEDKDVTLDLNGRTVANAESHTILNKGHLTLKDSSADKSGQIISLKGNTAALRNGDNAVCVVEGGTISRDGASGNTWHVVENFGKMTFNGGKVVLKNGNGFAITNGWNYFDPGASTTHAVMEINALELDTDSSGIKNCRYGDLTVNDVNVASTGYWALSNDYLGTAVINGGTFTSTSFKAVSNGAAMTVNGGTFDGTAGFFVQSYATSTVLNGGTYTNMNVADLAGYVGTGHTAQQSGTSVIIK
ncbi:SipW-dependent-type signal peptide-containing protein, partial [Vescimonas sp.]